MTKTDYFHFKWVFTSENIFYHIPSITYRQLIQ